MIKILIGLVLILGISDMSLAESAEYRVKFVWDNVVCLTKDNRTLFVKLGENVENTDISLVELKRTGPSQSIVVARKSGKLVVLNWVDKDASEPEAKPIEEKHVVRSLTEWQKLHDLEQEGYDIENMSEEDIQSLLKDTKKKAEDGKDLQIHKETDPKPTPESSAEVSSDN